MSDCCASKQNKHPCPVDSSSGHEVSIITVLHHIKEPWKKLLGDKAYFFCETPDCDVVYFSEDGDTIKQDQLRTTVGIKSSSTNALICYCYGVDKQQAEQNPETKAFVMQQTKLKHCACEARNPSGRCCLKDFPK